MAHQQQVVVSEQKRKEAGLEQVWNAIVGRSSESLRAVREVHNGGDTIVHGPIACATSSIMTTTDL